MTKRSGAAGGCECKIQQYGAVKYDRKFAVKKARRAFRPPDSSFTTANTAFRYHNATRRYNAIRVYRICVTNIVLRRIPLTFSADNPPKAGGKGNRRYVLRKVNATSWELFFLFLHSPDRHFPLSIMMHKRGDKFFPIMGCGRVCTRARSPRVYK